MRVLIEIDLPEGQAAPTPEDIIRLTDPNWLADWWHIDDIKEQYEGEGEYSEITEEQARKILRWMYKCHDASVGYNWDYVAECTEDILEEEKYHENV